VQECEDRLRADERQGESPPTVSEFQHELVEQHCPEEDLLVERVAEQLRDEQPQDRPDPNRD
jgi:hypothetical protein